MTGVAIPDTLQTLLVPIDSLKPYGKNPRRGDLSVIMESLTVNGQYRPIVVRSSTREILAGNHTFQAMRELGEDNIAATFIDCGDEEAAKIVAVDNRANDLATYDNSALVDLLTSIEDLAGTGFSQYDVTALLDGLLPTTATHTEPDAVPPLPAEPVSALGDVWLLGPHRLMCGDSTDRRHVRELVAGRPEAGLTLIQADPPYGMSKESDGVLNDNLHREELDQFQMAWFTAWSAEMAPNAASYIWGTAPDLWRLWYQHLESAGQHVLRNEIVWDKGSGMGMRSAGHHSYATATERCLFFMHGEQFLGSGDKSTYWPGWEPLRLWFIEEVKKAGWTNGDVNTLTNTNMAGHWSTTSQFAPISAKHYATLQSAAAGRAFTTGYDDLFAELFPGIRDGGNAARRDLAEQVRQVRSYFDNTHDAMTDVWQFPRVTGADRQGHATPKPVAMIERILNTSTRAGDWIGVPFGGSGPDFIAAEHLGRVAVGMELSPQYVDVICRRYQEHTGVIPILQATGVAHDFTEADQP